MFVRTYVCMYVCIVVGYGMFCTYLSTPYTVYSIQIALHFILHTCVSVYVCMHACMHGWMDGWMDAWMYNCIYIYMYMYINYIDISTQEQSLSLMASTASSCGAVSLESSRGQRRNGAQVFQSQLDHVLVSLTNV